MNFRYNIDGSQRRESEKERLESSTPRSSFVSAGPWDGFVDKQFFGFEGKANIKRHSIKYDQLKSFYSKFVLSKSISKSKNISKVKLMEDCLVYFEKFNAEKLIKTIKKITTDRNNLPIYPFKNTILEHLENNQVVLIAADTGAGKSTQVPQFLLECGYDKIACTQPRRIACYSLAKRVAYERTSVTKSSNESIEIAYKVRFEGTKTDKTKVLFLTEGVLLRQFASDSKLSAYNLIIIDEVHERHITGDFLLGVLKRLISIRDDVKVVLMSATINAELFSKYFNAPVVTVPGRMYPVQITYIPFAQEDRTLVDPKILADRAKQKETTSIVATQKSKMIDPNVYLTVLDRIEKSIPPDEKGDLLIFLSGIQEIIDLNEAITEYASKSLKWICLMLHSTLSVADQEKVFDIAPNGVRKVILSTNIAETSVTIDGIRFIVDCGKVKEMGFDADSGVSKLSEFWISRSSAKQRAGRAGRTGPGECFRLYSQREYQNLNEYPVPEILRSPLEQTLLQIVSFGLEPDDPRNFEFIQRPSTKSLDTSISRLINLTALEKFHQDISISEIAITPLGRILSILPVDVVLGKMLVWGSVCAIDQVLNGIVVIVSCLSVQTPFRRVTGSEQGVEGNREEIWSDHGDPFTLLNLMSEWLKVKAEKSESSRFWCKKIAVEEQRLYEIVKLKGQFEGILAAYMNDAVGEIDINGKSKKREYTDDDWKDPEFRKKRKTVQILKKQKLLQTSSKRQVLSLDAGLVDENDEKVHQNFELDEMNINELEFVLKNDADEMLEKTDVSNLTPRDVNLIKLILCSAMYPNFAIADESNYSRRLNEQVFHTKNKRFLSMHPTSIFSFKPEIVYNRPSDLPPTNDDESTKNLSLATLHAPVKGFELLVYLSLLETTKPYLMNVFRVPAVQPLLLFGQTVEVGVSMLDVIVDGWLHLRFDDRETAEKTLVRSNYLRFAWNYIVDEKLVNLSQSLDLSNVDSDSEDSIELLGTLIGPSNKPTGNPLSTPPLKDENFERKEEKASDLSKIKFIPPCLLEMRNVWTADEFDFEADIILDELATFMDLDSKCTVERAKNLDINPIFGKNCQKIEITPNLTFHVEIPEKYPEFENLVPKRPVHKAKVIVRNVQVNKEAEMEKKHAEAFDLRVEEKSKSLAKDYDCLKCRGKIHCSAIEFLRHKKECK